MKKEPGKGHEGWRSTIRGWLVENAMPPDDADAWLDEWDRAHAGGRHHPDTREYWDGCPEWIIEERNARRLPR